MKRGELCPYKIRPPSLYVHCLDVGEVTLSALVPFLDETTGYSTPKRLSLPKAQWWLSDNPKAFIKLETPSGNERRYGTLRQLTRPYTTY